LEGEFIAKSKEENTRKIRFPLCVYEKKKNGAEF
jgi:hypothetical protein